MSKSKIFRFLSVMAICLLFVLLALALLGQRLNRGYVQTEKKVMILDNEVFTLKQELPSREKECLVLWDGGEPNSEIAYGEISDILREMKVEADFVDVSVKAVPDCRKYQKVILAVTYYSEFEEDIYNIVEWVRSGGDALVFFPPFVDGGFRSVCPQMGIKETGWDRYMLPGIRFKTDLMIGGEGRDFMIEEPYESALVVSLSSDCTVHAVSADDREMPVLWEKNAGDGKVVFCNIGIIDKAYRGIYAAAYSLLGDVCTYPVINASSFYLDDFPSPVPSGSSIYIERDYGMDVKNFYTNIWWPDLLEFTEKYGIVYSGMVIEDYSDNLTVPFVRSLNTQRFHYFGSSLLEHGGEIGLHGYNHIPLCREGFDADILDRYPTGMDYRKLFGYKYWDTPEDMTASIQELYDFCGSLYPGEQFRVYVPPSNIISEEARTLMAENFPWLKAIASIYFEGDAEYTQEFEVGKDGIINTPRIISGGIIDNYMEIAALSELNMHFVNSHFQHPDDILDPDRGAERGWEALRSRLEEYMEWLYTSAPQIRNLTASEMAGAVQRYYYLDVVQTVTRDDIILDLRNFQDEAYLFIRMNDKVPENLQTCITGGTLTPLSGNLYLIKAEASHITIRRGGR